MSDGSRRFASSRSIRSDVASTKRTSARSRNTVKSSTSGVSRRGSSGETKSVKTAQNRKAREYRHSLTMKMSNSLTRIQVLFVLFSLLLGVAGIRAFQLQALDAKAFAEEAAQKMRTSRKEPALRGSIVDRNGVVLAETQPGFLVFVDPDMIQTNGADKRYPMTEEKKREAKAAPEAVANILVNHLGGRKEHYLEIFNRKNPKTAERSRYEIIARQVPAQTFNEIQHDMREGVGGDGKHRWYGVFGEPDAIRDYPNRRTGANLIGFVNAEGKGATGLEYSLQKNLKGVDGKSTFDRSTYGRIPLGTNVMVPAKNGENYRLTIDADLQWMSDQFLAEGIRKANAKTGMAVVTNVHSGEILALSVLPTFDASHPGKVDIADLNNRAVTQSYEPGSTQKILTMAALADQRVITPDTKVVVPSKIVSGGGFVKDAFSHGTINLTARGIVANSSNIGTIMLARQMEKAKLSSYLLKFGLGSKTHVGLPGEATGDVPGKKMPDYTRDHVSFGQGLSVTAVQMAAALAAAVNGGVYHQPLLIKGITDGEGKAVDIPAPQTRRVISEEASAQVRDMMEAVTMVQPSKRAIPGYRTIGKSGTAQRFNTKCKCYSGYTSSYVVAAPAEDPQLLVYVVIDQPTRGSAGSELALPVANQIMQVALPRYNVLPSTTPAPKKPTTFQ